MRVLLLIIILTSCSSIKDTLYFWANSHNLEEFKIVVDQKANQNSAIAVDLVFVYENSLAGRLEVINAKDWFSRKREYKLNFDTFFDVVSWELVPGQEAPEHPFPSRNNEALGIYVFTNYGTPNSVHGARVDQLKNVELFLGETNFKIKAVD
jgi:type VI secretion system protein